MGLVRRAACFKRC